MHEHWHQTGIVVCGGRRLQKVGPVELRSAFAHTDTLRETALGNIELPPRQPMGSYVRPFARTLTKSTSSKVMSRKGCK